MPLSNTEKTKLQGDVAALANEIGALVVDADVNPLQAQLDAANAKVVELQGKIDTAKAKLAVIGAADATEDQARAEAIAALG